MGVFSWLFRAWLFRAWLFRAWLFRAWLFRAWLFRAVPLVKALMLFSRNPEISFTRHARRFTERLGGEAEMILPLLFVFPVSTRVSLIGITMNGPTFSSFFMILCLFVFALYHEEFHPPPPPHTNTSIFFFLKPSYSVFVRLDYLNVRVEVQYDGM